ncbi:hypothetical protein BOX15_Mlig009743g1 [Macrostomum lignano]|uniref:V-type proton ATPase subunit G n=1 Tax=Macrostomum lignano TaxID=282301 RepID=A0A267DRM6_9PLAT|nr:hypothetical protein BOX15_Mlig008207g1 [Macrostomum lignano]PAA84733.1 hypothetical protein BOX15_Mlig008207g2 [Macrostomum lignano]PAA87699.1 hypothetical protein BOX15_Mlig009743g1 [Macrostomum lignano]
MTTQSGGIQMLLQAEKKAKEKIDEARKNKQRRLKQAKQEAAAEIDTFKKEREREFKEHEARILGSRTDSEKLVQEETRQRLSELETSVGQNKEEAIKRLLELVFDVQPKVHDNFKR